jgi:hypothetical protein
MLYLSEVNNSILTKFGIEIDVQELTLLVKKKMDG